MHRDEINKQMLELLQNDIVQLYINLRTIHLYGSFFKKPDENGKKRWRMVMDYRALNEKTVPDAHPLLRISKILVRKVISIK